MMLSFSKGYLFIANPKTGSTAVETFLKECDPSVMHNRLPGEKQGEIITGIHGHISARNLKKRMGIDYDKYKSIVFVRNPYGKSVSAYFFYKQGDLSKINFKK